MIRILKLSIIIPVYNEEKNIEHLVNKVKSVKLNDVMKEIIIIDDCSTDASKEKIKKMGGIKKIFHEKNIGKGGAIRTGIKHATGDIIIFQDADLEYNPEQYPELIQPIRDGKTQVVYGSRFKGQLKLFGEHKTILPVHYVGNKILTFATRILYNRNITDMETGYKVFSKHIIKNLHLNARRFDMEPEITAKILKRGHIIIEVPIYYHARGFEKGKKITWKDGVKALLYLLKYRFVD